MEEMKEFITTTIATTTTTMMMSWEVLTAIPETGRAFIRLASQVPWKRFSNTLRQG